MTVTAVAGDGTVGGDHDIAGSYQPLAAAVDASANASLAALRASLHGFLTAATVVTHRYQVVRAY